MIPNTELRIGNWVDGGNNGNLYYQIKTSDFANTNFDLTKPIPLTPEILEKCGFRMSLTKTCYGIITDDGRNRLSVFLDGRFKFHSEDLSVEVKHLHQLQNLYFALTGTELQIKL